VYGQKIQLANSDLFPLLDNLGIKRVQQIFSVFLYYSRSYDPTIIVALNKISNSQSSPTKHTQKACDMLLDYLSTHPNATIPYHASDMVLAVCSNATYLALPNTHSRAAGHFFLTDLPSATSLPPNPKLNGVIHVLCKTICIVAASVSEDETGCLFLNAQEAVPIRTALIQMGQLQPATPLEIDNSTAHGILHAQVRMNKSKAFNMRYHWLKDCIAQKQFNLYWSPGEPTMPIIFPNIILRPITNSCAISIFMARLPRQSRRLLCKGVLLPTGIPPGYLLLPSGKPPGYHFTADVTSLGSKHHSSH
jgi:hypothetical protein